MTPEQSTLFRTLNDEHLMALTIYLEAEGETTAGKFGVGYVISNRSDLWHKSVPDICLQKNQFECFNTGNPRLAIGIKIAQDFIGTHAKDINLQHSLEASRAIFGKTTYFPLTRDVIKNRVGLATFYKTLTVKSPWFDKMIAKGRLKEVTTIGHHVFYEEHEGVA
jgi:hypothetical protein